MKIFINRLFRFSFFPLLLFTLFVIPNIFFSERFTFRSWENLHWYKQPEGFMGRFYPNQSIYRTEYGDLGHDTQFAVSKESIWITDQLGFRNYDIPSKMDILIVGDSYANGCSVSQDETLSSQIKKLSGLQTYQMMIGLDKTLFMIETKKIPKPSVIIYNIVERNILEIQFTEKTRPSYSLDKNINDFDIFKDKVQKNVFMNRFISILNPNPLGIQSSINPKYFFLEGENALISLKNDQIDSITLSLSHYRQVLQDRGIKFLFLPVPNKETIYYDFVPLQSQPISLHQLYTDLEKSGINYINLLDVYNSNKDKTLLYHFDDSHWNSTAIKIAADEVINSQIF
ncbi:MAG: hypothetical protein JEY91_07985 [Spirochaetaceae bacterium]|nr:hypothetical protein [Spirochaetaceae bacterium]